MTTSAGTVYFLETRRDHAFRVSSRHRGHSLDLASGEFPKGDHPKATFKVLDDGNLEVCGTVWVSNQAEQKSKAEHAFRLECAQRRFDRDALKQDLDAPSTTEEERCALRLMIAKHGDALREADAILALPVQVHTTKFEETCVLLPGIVACVPWLNGGLPLVWIPQTQLLRADHTFDDEYKVAIVKCQQPALEFGVQASGQTFNLTKETSIVRLSSAQQGSAWTIPGSEGQTLQDYAWGLVPVAERIAVCSRKTGRLDLFDPMLPTPQQWRRLADLPDRLARVTSDLGDFVYAVGWATISRLDVGRNRWETVRTDLELPRVLEQIPRLQRVHLDIPSGTIFARSDAGLHFRFRPRDESQTEWHFLRHATWDVIVREPEYIKAQV